MTVGNDRSALHFSFTLLEAPVSTLYRFKEGHFLEGRFWCLTLEDSCFRKKGLRSTSWWQTVTKHLSLRLSLAQRYVLLVALVSALNSVFSFKLTQDKCDLSSKWIVVFGFADRTRFSTVLSEEHIWTTTHHCCCFATRAGWSFQPNFCPGMDKRHRAWSSACFSRTSLRDAHNFVFGLQGQGAEMYLKEFKRYPWLHGKSFSELGAYFPDSVVMVSNYRASAMLVCHFLNGETNPWIVQQSSSNIGMDRPYIHREAAAESWSWRCSSFQRQVRYLAVKTWHTWEIEKYDADRPIFSPNPLIFQIAGL